MKLVFIDQDGAFTEELAKLLPASDAVSYLTGNVQDISQDHTAFVTLLNSLLFMDGGIDRVYSREMFPGIEKVFKKMISECGHESLVGKKYLPIGSSIMCRVKTSTYLIGAPSMLMPQPVPNTRNAYWATLASLYLADKAEDAETLVIPPPACGWGKMTPVDSARQVWWALMDYQSVRNQGSFSTKGQVTMYHGVHFPLAEQPNYYENSEFKTISADKIARER